jgi:AP-3 complex subunit delta-1
VIKYPEALQSGVTRLKEKLEDPDPGAFKYFYTERIDSLFRFSGVVASTVNVLCELARRNPEDYLTLAPQLFHLLTTSTNNWMLIKIVKLVSNTADG